jgi:ubiquinone/menaquinone biosynthesis C-methylase UbiE
MEAQFGKTASLYATSEHAGGDDLARLVEFAAPVDTEVAVDVATGAGHTAAALAPRVRFVLATDVALGMLAQARRLLGERGVVNADVAFADAERLPFERAAFDLVTCRIAPHHFADLPAAVAEATRVLRPGGRYVVVDSLAPDDPEEAAFLHEVEVRRDPTHVRALSQGEWVQAMEHAGLAVEQVAVERKRRDFERWLDRGSVDDAERARLRRKFLDAGEAIHRAFAIEIEDGAVTHFTDDKLVISARRS